MKWSKHIIKIIVAFSIPSPLYAWFSYDKAAHAGQSGQWQQAMQCMKNVINQNPNDPRALYDAGVAAYRNKEFVQAQAYFHQASVVSCSADNLKLQERSHFNEGNALAQLQRYQDAIDSYEKVLALNADNQQAQENIALLKKLLEQQQEQEKNKDQQKNQQQKNNSDQHKQKDEQNNQQQEQHQQDNQQQEDQDNAPASADNESDDGEDEDRDGDHEPAPAQEQQEQQQEHEKEEQQPQSRTEQPGQSAPQRAQQQSKESSGIDAQSGKQEHAPQQVSAWLDTILSEREKQDEAVNKALIKMQTAQQPQGSHNAAAHNW